MSRRRPAPNPGPRRLGPAVVAAALLAAALAAPAPALAQAGLSRDCLYVDAKQGWQALPKPSGAVVDIEVSGAWTVLAATEPPVGPRGHLGEAAKRLAVWNGYKFDQGFSFGALLYRAPGGAAKSFMDLAARVGIGTLTGQDLARIGDIELRINDSDAALGDNSGRLRVCLVHAPTG